MLSSSSTSEDESDFESLEMSAPKKPRATRPVDVMKIAIDSPDKLKDSDLEEIVDTWNRKSRRLPV